MKIFENHLLIVRCFYCESEADGIDALGLYSCKKHICEADKYVEENYGKESIKHVGLPMDRECVYDDEDKLINDITAAVIKKKPR